MATYNGEQYQDAYADVPSSKIPPGDDGGVVRRKYFSWAVPASVIALNATVALCKIPKGARIYDAFLQSPDQGTTGLVTLGWAAGAGAVESADDDGLLTSFNVKAAADGVSLKAQIEAGGANPGFLKDFSEEVDVELKVTEAFDAGTGTIKGYIEYVLV